MATYRKTKNGDWVAYGPATEVKPGDVAVTKRNGTVDHVTVDSVGKTFKVNGVDHVYGYFAPKPATRRRNADRGWCDECGERATPGTECWETGLIH